MITNEEIVSCGRQALLLAEEAAGQHLSSGSAPGQFPAYVSGLAPAILTVLIAKYARAGK